MKKTVDFYKPGPVGVGEVMGVMGVESGQVTTLRYCVTPTAF